MLRLRLRLPPVTQTGAECRCRLPLAMSRPASGSLVGAQLPASPLLAWLPWGLLTWGLTVFWAFEGSQPCLALTPGVPRWGFGVQGEEYT